MVKNVRGQSGHKTLKLTVSRVNRWNELIFCMLMQFSKAQSYFSDLWVNVVGAVI